jgi:hypothetical protein
MAAGFRSLPPVPLGPLAPPVGPLKAGYRSLLALWTGGACSGGIIIPPTPEPPSLAHGAGMEQYRQHLRQQAIALDDEEILLILSEAIGVIE